MEDVFETTTGYRLKLRPVSPLLLARLTARFTFPKKPNYTITTVAGETETHEHDEKSLRTDEDRAAWEAWKRESLAAARQNDVESTRFYLTLGLVQEYPEDDAWLRRHRFCGFEVPEDPLERWLYFVVNEAAPGPGEGQRLVDAIMGLTFPGLAEAAAARNSFRGPVEEQGPGEPANPAGAVAAQPDADDLPDSPRLGADAGGVSGVQ